MKYYSIEHTPLKWHTFYRYVSMPLGAITGIIALVTNIAAMDNAAYLIDIFFNLVQTVCCAAAFVGCFKWKPYAWYAIMINLVAIVVYAVVVVIITAIYGGNVAYSMGTVLGSGISCTLIGIYYNKRKPLFFGTPAPVDAPAYGLPNRVDPNNTNY